MAMKLQAEKQVREKLSNSQQGVLEGLALLQQKGPLSAQVQLAVKRANRAEPYDSETVRVALSGSGCDFQAHQPLAAVKPSGSPASPTLGPQCKRKTPRAPTAPAAKKPAPKHLIARKQPRALSRRPKKNFRIVAVEGQSDLGVPYYLVNLWNGEHDLESYGQYLGRDPEGGVAGPFALAFTDMASGKEVQQNSTPTAKATPQINEDRELIANGLELDMHGFLTAASLRTIALALANKGEDNAVVVRAAEERERASAASKAKLAKLKSSEASESDSDSSESSTSTASSGDSLSDGSEAELELPPPRPRPKKRNALPAAAPAFATYEEKMEWEVAQLPRKRQRVSTASI
jgi:hypothetical protein